MLKTLFNTVAFCVSLFVLYSVYQSVNIPTEFKIAVSRNVEASPSKVFDLLNMSARFSEWEPWSKADPTLKMFFDGPATGLGSIVAWNSKRRGNVTVQWRSAVPNKEVSYAVAVQDYGGRYDMVFEIEQDLVDDHLVKLTWQLSGRRKPLEKPFWYFLKLDATIRRDFLAGLENMENLLKAGK